MNPAQSEASSLPASACDKAGETFGKIFQIQSFKLACLLFCDGMQSPQELYIRTRFHAATISKFRRKYHKLGLLKTIASDEAQVGPGRKGYKFLELTDSGKEFVAKLMDLESSLVSLALERGVIL